MARARRIRGEMGQGHTPNWQPLLAAVGHRVTGDFMWMFDVELRDGRALQAYKHIDTRGYVHLDAEGGAFVYEPPHWYRPHPAGDVLRWVFLPLLELRGVSREQIRVSWDAVARLKGWS